MLDDDDGGQILVTLSQKIIKSYFKSKSLFGVGKKRKGSQSTSKS